MAVAHLIFVLLFEIGSLVAQAGLIELIFLPISLVLEDYKCVLTTPSLKLSFFFSDLFYMYEY